VLNLAGNKLTLCPASLLSHLRNVVLLNLADNQLCEESQQNPMDVTALRDLQLLDLSGNQFNALPNGMGE
jgi:Leucine-rich repeat (LRR) protein